MKRMSTGKLVFRGSQAAALLGALVLLQACSTDKVSVPTDLVGPSALGTDLKLQALPDVVVADNTSVSQIVATLRGPNGQPLSGRAIVFEITDPTGVPATIGELSSTTGVVNGGGSSATAVTNGSGVATVSLSAPAREDFIAPANVLVRARPIGDDFNGAVFRSVSVQIVPAEARLFPPNPNNKPPTCLFTVQPFVGPGVGGSYPVGFVILFQSTAFDTDGKIVRYEWDFADGGTDSKPDVSHAFGQTGTFRVQHTVTDNNGAQASCFADIVVK